MKLDGRGSSFTLQLPINRVALNLDALRLPLFLDAIAAAVFVSRVERLNEAHMVASRATNLGVT